MKHPQTARWYMVVMKIIIVLLAWYVGNHLQQLNISFTQDSFYITVAAMFTGLLLYPDRRTKKIYFEYRYYIKQKCCDGIIAFSSFVMFVIVFNTNFLSQPSYAVVPLYSIATGNDSTKPTVGNSNEHPKKLTAKQKRAFKKFFFKQLKKTSALTKIDKQKRNELRAEMAAAIVLASLLAVVILVLACSLICSGNELGAALLVIFGAGAIFAGLSTWLRSIHKRRRLLKTQSAEPAAVSPTPPSE